MRGGMKKFVVVLLGGILSLAGLALLVLPGPGFVLIAAGLAVLATQFQWARRPLEYARAKAEQGMVEVVRHPWRAVLAALCGLALLAIGVLELAGIDVPFVNVLSAVMLVLSGVGLLGTLVYAARRPPAAAPPSATPGL